VKGSGRKLSTLGIFKEVSWIEILSESKSSVNGNFK